MITIDWYPDGNEKPIVSQPLTDEEIDEFRKEWLLILEDLTCKGCLGREECEFVDDPYNTDGDCLAMK